MAQYNPLNRYQMLRGGGDYRRAEIPKGGGERVGTQVTAPLAPVAPPAVTTQAATPTTTAPAETGAGGVSGGFWSPELEGLKHSYLTTDYNKKPEYFDKTNNLMDLLMKRTDVPVGTSEQERQTVYNQARGQIQGATRTAMAQMAEKFAARGLKPGESGIADGIMSEIARMGAKNLTDFSTNQSINEVNTRFDQGMSLENLNLQKLLGAGQAGGLLNDMDLGRLGMGLNAAQIFGGMEGQEASLRQAAANASSSNSRWSQEFEYGKKKDSMGWLMGLYGMGQGAQQTQWNPYWQGLLTGGYNGG